MKQTSVEGLTVTWYQGRSHYFLSHESRVDWLTPLSYHIIKTKKKNTLPSSFHKKRSLLMKASKIKKKSPCKGNPSQDRKEMESKETLSFCCCCTSSFSLPETRTDWQRETPVWEYEKENPKLRMAEQEDSSTMVPQWNLLNNDFSNLVIREK